MSEPRVIDADVYDALELVALAMGGVGKGTWFKDIRHTDGQFDEDLSCPVCINGMGVFLGLTGPKDTHPTVIASIGITYTENDDVVGKLVLRGQFTVGDDNEERVSFANYVAELNVVRGGT